MWFMVFYALVIFAGLAMTVREGLWSNMLILINITISGLVAFAFYSRIVIWLDEMSDGEHTYWLDFAVIWALYAATFVIIRTVTAAASKTRMRFKHPIDPVGGPLVGFISAWVTPRESLKLSCAGQAVAPRRSLAWRSTRTTS